MCKYCERRTDVKLGWDQPELPWHNNQDITRNISGNMIHTDDTVGVIHDYQTSSPVLILKDKSCFGSDDGFLLSLMVNGLFTVTDFSYSKVADELSSLMEVLIK